MKRSSLPVPGEKLKSTCCYCGVGCGVILSLDRNGSLEVKGDPDHPVNQGMLCSKGLNLHHTVNNQSDRLTFPQVRYSKAETLQKASWDEALDRCTRVFKTLISRFGPDSVAFYASGQCLTEEYYVINKLVKGFLGTNNLDTNSRLCMSSAVSAYKLAFGEDIVPVSYDDLEKTELIYVMGANPAWCHPILWRRIEACKSKNPSLQIIVVDPRKTSSCELADVHVQLLPGTDTVLNHAVARLLIEWNLLDHAFINNHTNGFEAFKHHVNETSLEQASRICGLPEQLIVKLARMLGSAKSFISLWAMGLNQSAMGVSKNVSLINLHLITGQIARPGAGPLSLTGQPNAMGGRETGGMANLLPAHRDLGNPLHRLEVKEFWKCPDISPRPGLTATEIFDSLNTGSLKAVWIIGTNPLVSLPDARLAEQALRKAAFVVVQEASSRSSSVSYADVVLPAASWAEKQGTMTNSERRITFLNKCFEPPGEALPDAEIICRFAQKMGFSGFDFLSEADIYDEHAALTKGTHIDISALSHDWLKAHGSTRWPFKLPTSTTDISDKQIFPGQEFFTLDKKANIKVFQTGIISETVSEEFPFVLTTGRIRDQWHTMTKTGKVNKLNTHIPESFAEIHPQDAASLSIKDGDLVNISSRRGEVRVRAKITDTIRKGVTFMPMHWGKLDGIDLHRVNNLTNPLLDPISGEPDFKYCAVRIALYKKPKQRIVIIGGGAAACAFVKTYRPLADKDEITLFSLEKHAFYNRVMLPDYISGAKSWDDLQKLTGEELSRIGIKLHLGVAVENIDRGRRMVIDSNGIKTPYDILILAMGSRPNRPREIPSMNGIHTMRTRQNADDLVNALPVQGHVAILGGGLLGLEMAASLREKNFKVTLIHRVSRFMNRQLDPVGSSMLAEEMIDQGCDIYFDDEIQVFYGRSKLTGLGLKSGKRIACDALLVAVGTLPNLELAKSSGLLCKRGVVVNSRMGTSDPAIFALGELAEFENTLYGTTAAAEQQAAILARSLAGDVGALYKGSLSMNIIKIHGFDLCSMGIPECPSESAYEEVVFIDRSRRAYKKCIIHQDRLVGAILIGDKAEFTEFKMLISEKTELSAKRMTLLRGSGTLIPVLGKLICSCNQVGEINIQNLIKNGCVELDELCRSSGAGTGCGSCKPELIKLLAASNSQGLVKASSSVI